MSLIIQENSNVFKTKFTTAGAFIVALLSLSLLALLERILYDAARILASGSLDYFQNIHVVILHSIIIIIFLLIALFTNLGVSNNQKYAIALLPYYIVAIFLSCQLLLQVSVYFYNHHTTLQFYVVMLALIIVSTYGIYFIQKKHIIE